MRTARIAGGMALWLLFGGLAPAVEPQPYDAVVGVPEVDVRSGPSEKSYPTNKLRQNDRVKVLREEGDWLAITPPPGSFSWINSLYLQRSGPQTALVKGDRQVPVRVGSALRNGPPDKLIHVSEGSHVVIVGKELVANDGVWWPIQPPPSEVRYLPRSAVKTTSVQAVAAVPVLAAPPANPTLGSPAAPALDSNALLERARQAEEKRNFGDAEALYSQLANQTNDANLRIRLQNHIQFLREQGRPPVTAGYQPVPQGAGTAPLPVRPVPASGSPYPPASNPTAAPLQASAAAPPMSSASGYLRKTGYSNAERQIYRLETETGQLLMYLRPQSGLNLKSYVDYAVQVWGPVSYEGELKAKCMVVSGGKLLQ